MEEERKPNGQREECLKCFWYGHCGSEMILAMFGSLPSGYAEEVYCKNKRRDQAEYDPTVKYLYHVTEPQNVDSIMRNGLLRCHDGKRTAFLHLSEHATMWFRPGLEIIRVDITGLDDIEMTTFLPISDEILVWGDIPPIVQYEDKQRCRFKVVTDDWYIPEYHSTARYSKLNDTEVQG